MTKVIHQIHQFLTGRRGIAPSGTARLLKMSAALQNRWGKQEGNGKRINKQLHFDLCSVNVLDKKEISDFIRTYPQLQNITLLEEEPVSNLQLFRYYAERYLLQHPDVNPQMDIIIAEKEPSPLGLPLHVYFFLHGQKRKAYENIQSDIFAHLRSTASQFGLKMYQYAERDL